MWNVRSIIQWGDRLKSKINSFKSRRLSKNCQTTGFLTAFNLAENIVPGIRLLDKIAVNLEVTAFVDK